MPNKAHVLNVSEKWHVAYFGTKVETLRRILDTGDLHSTGKVKGGWCVSLSVYNISEVLNQSAHTG